MPTSGETVPQLPVDRAALVIGVTGTPGVAVSAEPSVRDAFAAILDELTQRCPNTPIAIVTALSSPGELVAAEVAAERGLPLVAVLAKPADELLRDAAEVRAERVRAMLARCVRINVIDVKASRPEFEAAMHVAHDSHLVVAFFDGDRARLDGECGAIVAVRIDGIADRSALAYLPYMPDVGPVFQVAPSQQPAAPPGAPYVAHYPVDYSGENPERDFAATLRSLDAYNADLGTATDRTFALTMKGLFEKTDAAAERLQRTTFRFLFVLYAVAIIATAVQYLAYQWLKYVALAGAFVAYAWARAKDYENRFQDYRVVSEGLRVQLAWKDAGLADQAEQCYLGRQQADLQWIRMALRYFYLAFEGERGAGAAVTSVGTTAWIEGQREYFGRKPKEHERSLRRIQVLVRVLFAATLLATAVSFVILYVPGLPATMAHIPFLSHTALAGAVASIWSRVPFFSSATFSHVDPFLESVMLRLSTAAFTMYAAIALLISNYCDKRAYTQNIKRYNRMVVVFGRAQKRIADLGERANSPDGEQIVRELGQEALIENADWLLNRRERPFSFVS